MSGESAHEILHLFLNRIGWSKYQTTYDADNRLFLVYALFRNELTPAKAQVVKDVMLNPHIKLARQWYERLSLQTISHKWETDGAPYKYSYIPA